MLKKETLDDVVLTPVLRDLELYSWSAKTLLTGIFAHESKGGIYLDQIGYEGKNEALGAYGMQSDAVAAIEVYFHGKIEKENSKDHKVWWDKVQSYYYQNVSLQDNLKYNLLYSTAMCRLFFVRFEDPLPSFNDINAMARYWKEHYNTAAGDGTVEKFVENYCWYCNE